MKYRYRQLEELRESKIKDIGLIPKKWVEKKLKHELDFTVGGTPLTSQPNYFNGDNTWVTIGDLRERICSTSKQCLSREGIKSANIPIVPQGALLYSFKLSVGQVAFAGKDIYTNEAIASFKPSERYNVGFWYYGLPIYVIKNANENIYGAKLLNQDLIKNAYLVLPSKEEQIKIVKFLDEKTSQFDAIIGKKEALIQKLEEAKKSLISEVVTGKVKVIQTNEGYQLIPRNEDEMKDSGIEWIDKIPKGWEIRRIKYLLEESKEKSKDGSEEPLSMSQKYGLIRTSQMDNIPNQAMSLVGNKICNKDDLVFNKLKAHLGVFAVANERGIVSPDYAVYRRIGNIDIKYYEYLFKTPLYICQFKRYSTGVGEGLTRLYTDQLFNIYGIVPKFEEQRLIAHFLNNRLEQISSIVHKTRKQIKVIKEAKQSLVSEAVTGKIEILED